MNFYFTKNLVKKIDDKYKFHREKTYIARLCSTMYRQTPIHITGQIKKSLGFCSVLTVLIKSDEGQ